MNFFKKHFAIALLALTNLCPVAGTCDNVVDIACSVDDFSILCAAITQAGLADALSTGEWTVFAPINRAFEELGDLLDTVLADKALLTDILLFHAIPEVVAAGDLECTGLSEMANGQDSRTVCQRGGKVFQKGGSNPRNDMPAITDFDIETCQGYIHIVDEVLLPGRLKVSPPSKPECQTIAEIACTDDFSTLCTAVTQAGLVDALNGGTWTVFAPTNDAFEKLGDTLNDVLADNILLTDILLFHAVMDKTIFESDFKCTRTTRMANGKDSRHVCLGNGDVHQKGAGNSRNDMPRITSDDIGACNGVIHVIDEVMLP